MARLHIQCNSPKYDDMLPAHAMTTYESKTPTVAVLWESYINPRTQGIVYLSSINGRYCMISEESIVEGSVKEVEYK